MRECVLLIFYKDHEGNLKREAQGKIFQKDGRWIYLADMTPAKLFYKVNGYAISRHILDAFSKAKIKPRILYRLKEKGIVYETVASTFKSKGILVNYGNHTQWILPLNKWKVVNLELNERKDYPTISVSEWLKEEDKDIAPQIDSNLRARLKKEFNRRYKV